MRPCGLDVLASLLQHKLRLHMSRFFLAALAGLAFALVPATSSAISLQEILSLSRAGVSSQVIVALIQRDKDVFT